MRLPTTTPIVVVLALSGLSSIASAQAALELPAPSPHARVEQRVGITDVSVDYSCPGVKGRKIWGELVPYDKVWRAGANAPTKLTVSREFSFGGTQVPAGSYSLFITPGKTTWTVMLNKNLTATQDQHDAKDDVATIKVRPIAMPQPRERLRYTLDDTQDDRTMLDLEWERVRIQVPITIDTRALVNAAIDKAVGEAWRPHVQAASYLFDTGQVDRALALVDRSIAIQPTWRGEWLRAQIQWKKGNKPEARSSAARAQELGKGDAAYEQNVKATLEKTIAGWK
ncbi:MAG TPA: DUF2911 domain-containing protein [Kofleriaceae bacterium]|nr:DUF2911 domain-containing protein [Kofleriaceae bacterium]